MRAVVTLCVFLGLVAGAALFGAQFTPGEWYQSLRRPPLTPPSWLFGPVWTLLYLAIAIAAFLVWRAPERSSVGLGLGLWAAQLVLNALWSYLFFGLHRPDLAFADIVALWLVILATTVGFWRVSTVAGVLLLPYLAWVAFAAALNLQLWRLN